MVAKGKAQSGADAVSAGACLLLAGVALLGGLWGCINDDEDQSAEEIVTEAVCGQFGLLVEDAAAGIVTPGEYRSRLQDIRREADLVDAQLGAAATDMLAAATAGDVDAEASEVFIRRCAVLLAEG